MIAGDGRGPKCASRLEPREDDVQRGGEGEGGRSPAGSDVLGGDGGRGDVREAVVRLGEEDEEEGEAGEAEGCDPREDVRPARADDQSSPEEEEQDVREEVPQDSRRG